ncbi:hypothetical protein FNH04_11460 [Streptomyces phyllanthi]|uniref:Uncharacterized protein n=2 Tax=Streptomyces phyllanthi TaxID=1803180 RepID=A0A5N8VZ09_9ACTN|nr:hypothetical protein [Streptomyces phyllanthi]
MGGSGGADLRRGLEALKTFKKRVDGVLANLEGSPASSTKVGEHQLSRASFSGQGTDFAEASGLFAQYNRVHDRLTSLSKSLGLHIESLGIAVHGADIGFDNLEEEQRRRFWEIQTQIDREYRDAEREKAAAQREKDGQAPQERSDDKKAEAGY